MSEYFCISVKFLDPRFHGRGDGGRPEWPPSALRLFQAIVAANADEIGMEGGLDRALAWLEAHGPPLIVAPRGEEAQPYCLSVPNNAMDLVAKAWSRENYFGSGDASPATHRTMKSVSPVRMCDGDTVHYAWRLAQSQTVDADVIRSLLKAARRVVALGWGIDLVVAHAEKQAASQLRVYSGERWLPTAARSPVTLRTPVQGTLAALQKRHSAFLQRIDESGFHPVAPLTRFAVTAYRRPSDPMPRPFATLELRHDDGSFCRYPQRKLIHIAGMVRHLAKEAMLKSPPSGVDDGWVERYIVGHRDQSSNEHRQLSYLPLPSIGHRHADQAVRRVMIAAPVGDDAWLEHVARRLDGRQLKPLVGNEFGEQGPPSLVRVHRDNVADCYTTLANQWTSVTPVILPGHNDRKAGKTRKLIEAALGQAGIDVPCTYEWSAVSRFRNYDYDNRETGYLRPAHLKSQTAVHLTVTFSNDVEMPGPLAIGAGRHCGLGVLAAMSIG